jgi:glycosyltransferase involved in cell wall biosynthesis
MKILNTVQYYDPSQGGMQAAVKEISERLVEHGVDVTVATTSMIERKSFLINGVKVKQFNLSGNEANGIVGSEEEKQSYISFLQEQDFDVIVFWQAQVWNIDLIINDLKSLRAKKIFVPTSFSGFLLPEYAQYFANMKETINHFDKIIFIATNSKDYIFCSENLKDKSKMVVIPNGASEREFVPMNTLEVKKKYGINRFENFIFHVGTHTKQKGHSEIFEMFDKSKFKNTVVWIMGNDLTKPLWGVSFIQMLKNFKFNLRAGCLSECLVKSIRYNFSYKRLFDRNKIIVKYVNRKSTVELFSAADLFLFPSNTEGSPVVIFEAMASGVPFAITEVGNATELVKWSNNAGIVLPTHIDEKGLSHALIEQSSDIIYTLLQDKAKLNEMSLNGKNSWKENYTWDIIAIKYLELFEEICKKQ